MISHDLNLLTETSLLASFLEYCREEVSCLQYSFFFDYFDSFTHLKCSHDDYTKTTLRNYRLIYHAEKFWLLTDVTLSFIFFFVPSKSTRPLT